MIKNNNISQWSNVYFIGIGGIGMSALARYFVANGKQVAGYDKTPSRITNDLVDLGVHIHFKDDVKLVSNIFLEVKNTLIVYTPAIKNHTELLYFIKKEFTVLKRAEVLGMVTENTYCFAVAGTHGKTTTSSILGHIMQTEKATAFLGGIAENYQSNLILGKNKITVVEADEFDRSFLQLSPNIACITSVDADHLDIYGNHDIMLQSFKNFTKKVSDKLIVAIGTPFNGITYAIEKKADYKAFDVRIENGTYIFNVQTPIEIINDIKFSLPGKHNIMNALAALSMANEYGISLEVIKERLQSFKGVNRRFSYRIKTNNLVLIDDYAHHPTEINAVADSVKEMYPNQKILAVFQPHLFSRTQDFADDFAKSLAKFDELLLLDIYPAREKPIKGITSNWLLEKTTLNKKKITTKKNLASDITQSNAKIIVMLGAGDIGLLVHEVKNKLLKK